MRAGAFLRVFLLLAFFATCFMFWLGRIGAAVGACGLTAVVAVAAVRGSIGKWRLEQAMRDADRGD
jgi:hypothetical protein